MRILPRIGVLLLAGACARTAPMPEHSPLTARGLKELLPPPLERFEALVTRDSARFRMPVLGADSLRWDVVPYEERPGVEYMFEVQWDTTRSPLNVGRYVEAVQATLDNPPQAPHRGTLGQLIDELTVRAVGLSMVDGRIRGGWVADRSIRVTAEDSSLVIWMGSSARLARLRRTHPDSADITVFASPQGTAYNRTLPIRYR
jgi:hypothetical protein